MKGNKPLPAGITDVHYFTFYCLLFGKCGGVCVHERTRDWQIKVALGMNDVANLVLHSLCTFANIIVNKPHTGEPRLQPSAHCCHPCVD